MIKNTLIVILLILLLVTIYAYICLSRNMEHFQKKRMEHIANKEIEIKIKEQNLVSMSNCNNIMMKYKQLLDKLEKDINNTSVELSNISKYTSQINNSIKLETTNYINPSTNNNTNNTNNTNNNVISENNIPVIHVEHMEQEDIENFENMLDKQIDKDDVLITALD